MSLRPSLSSMHRFPSRWREDSSSSNTARKTCASCRSSAKAPSRSRRASDMCTSPSTTRHGTSSTPAVKTIIVVGLDPGPHKVLVELADPTHRVIDRRTVSLRDLEAAGRRIDRDAKAGGRRQTRVRRRRPQERRGAPRIADRRCERPSRSKTQDLADPLGESPLPVTRDARARTSLLLHCFRLPWPCPNSLERINDPL